MKASIIFRDEQNPILRAKIPLNFFGFPFRSAIEVADAADLSFTFTTFFRSGPSFNLSYRPNDSLNPLTLAVKAGIGLLGSPIHAPMTFTAEFNLPANESPRFFLHFRPRLGDFTLRRSVQSPTPDLNLPYRNAISRMDDDDVATLRKGKSVDDGGGTSRDADCDLTLRNAVSSIDYSQVLNRIEDVLSSVEISARSAFKVRERAAVKLRWNMRFPASMKKEDFSARIPYLALGKIKIERVAANDGERENDEAAGAGEYSALKKKLDHLWSESRWLKKNVEQLRSEIGEQKAAPANPPVESRKKKGG